MSPIKKTKPCWMLKNGIPAYESVLKQIIPSQNEKFIILHKPPSIWGKLFKKQPTELRFPADTVRVFSHDGLICLETATRNSYMINRICTFGQACNMYSVKENEKLYKENLDFRLETDDLKARLEKMRTMAMSLTLSLEKQTGISRTARDTMLKLSRSMEKESGELKHG